MTERKRRKVADERRLNGLIEDLIGISDSIAQCAFPKPSTLHTLPLRSVPSSTPERSSIPQPQRSASSRPQHKQKQQKAPATEPPKTLFSVVCASTHALKTNTSTAGRENWKQSLLGIAKEVAQTDIEVEDRCGRLLRRYDSLVATVDMYQDRLQRESNEILLNERVESQLEREEKEWEEKMQTREQRVAELEVELKAFQEGDDAVLNSENRDEDAGDISTEEKDDQVGVSDDEASDDDEQASKATETREALALRMEEKRDIDAAVQSLKRKKRQRSFQAEQRAQERESVSTSENERELLQELLKLQEEKDALQLQIITSEEENELSDGHQADISKLRAAIGENKEQRVAAQDRLEEVKHALNRLKAKMKHMVDVQILTARDTIPSTLREEAVILHLLYQHEGEMGVNELKQEAAEILTSHGKASSNGATIRALYSLVANGVVQIDRSYGNGLVTSLLV